MNRKLFLSIPAALCLLLAAALLVSCADDDLTGGPTDRGAAVSFTVGSVQDEPEAQARDAGLAHAAPYLGGQGLTAADLSTRRLAANSPAGIDACLVESTVEGVNPVKAEPQSRADVKTSIDGDFSSLGYSGASAASISSAPDWFHNARTKSDGTLYSPIYWSWEGNRFGRFYGVYPEVTASYAKLTLSPSTHGGTPYVDFEAEADVKNQKDLMTACSGVVEYATQGVAPTTNLNFRHALTAVRFAVGQNLSWDKTIDRVEIRNALGRGRYTMATDENGTNAAWSGQDARTTFTLSGLSVSTKEAVNTVIMGNNGDNFTFYMIPQTLTGNNVQVYIHFTDNTEITATLTGSWKAGTTKTYKLSNTTSNWTYTLTSTSPTAIAYTESVTGAYGITSYRQAPDGTQQPVAWEVVGYDADNDGTFSMTEKPSWLTSLSKTSGTGGTAAETGTLTVDIIDHIPPRNNILKNAAAKGSSSSPYNLANSTGAATVENTANSYLISAPGHYRIPLVYGNAVKNGADNPGSYRTSNSGTQILQNFKDHAGANITSPYINVQNATNPATQASIVWADESGLVTNLSLTGSGSDSYLQFEVPQAAIRQGNAVVAVKNASGTIMWSWHLWFAPASALSTIPCTNFQGYTYNFTEENLGCKYTAWSGSTYTSPRSVRVKVQQTATNGGVKQETVVTLTQNNGGIRQAVNPFYQFGRKDALPATDVPAEGSFTMDGGDNMSIQNGIQNPGTFYTWGASWYDYPPIGYSYYNLWSMENTTTGWNNNAVVKTVYDPCPVGFRMPASNAFSGFTTTGQNTSTQSQFNVTGDFDLGWNFKTKIGTNTVYFPASGFRGRNDGTLRNVGFGSQCWSAVPGNTGSGCSLNFSPWNVYPVDDNSRTSGFSVRPVSE